MKPTRPPAPELAEHWRTSGAWSDRTVADLLHDAVTRRPDATALVDGERRWTFAQLDTDANAVAAALRGRGVGVGDVVTFQLPNRAETVLLFHAIMKIGAVANPVIPIYRAREVTFILRQARSRIAFLTRHHRGTDRLAMYEQLCAELPDLDQLIVLDHDEPDRPGVTSWDTFLADAGSAAERTPLHADDVCLLLYTSGTTADPKGVLHTHNTLGFDAAQVAAHYDLSRDDVVYSPSPITHVTGVCCAMVIPALVGGAVVLQDSWNPHHGLQLIRDEHATFMVFSTPFLAGLMDAVDPADPPTSIRYIVCGGADVPDILTRRATDVLGTVTRMFGATENPSATGANQRDDIELRLTSDGRPLDHTEIRLDPVDTDEERDAGEILLRGPDTMVGYLDAALNDDVFTDDGWFRTGDLGRFDEAGALHVVGRIKDIINRSGEKISAYEVENLISDHPAVADVAVVAGPDDRTGERACAFLVAGRSTPSLTELRAFLLDHGLATQKVPESLFTITALPRNASGKVQKFALRRWLRDRDDTPVEMAGCTVTDHDERERLR